MSKAIEALKLAQNKLGNSRMQCEPEFDRPTWDIYQAGIDELTSKKEIKEETKHNGLFGW